MKKKIVGILAAAVIGTTAFATVASAASGTINVISREDGSGTRGAFIELFGIQEEKDGEKGKPGKAYASQTAGAGYAEGYDHTVTAVCHTADDK